MCSYQMRPDQTSIADGTTATLYTIFLPLNHNDGRHIPRAHLDWAQREILRSSSGLTRLPPSVGYWVDRTGRMFRDLVMPLQVAAPAGPDAQVRFAHLAARMAATLEQEEIFVFSQPVWHLEAATHPYPSLAAVEVG